MKALAAVPLLALAALACCLIGLLPGRWRMRNVLEDHRERAVRVLVERVARRVEGYRAENATVPADCVLFLGSSTIDRFPLDESFPRACALARGIPDEPSWSLARRLEASLPDAAPAGVVLYAGGPDYHCEHSPAPVIAQRVGRVLDELRRLLPTTPVAQLAILPRREMSPAELAELRALNATLRASASARGVSFVDTHVPPITDSTGSLAALVSTDALHLGPDGYRRLTEAILADGGEVAEELRR